MIKLLLLTLFLRAELPKPNPDKKPKKRELPISSQYWAAGCFVLGCGLMAYKIE